MSPVAVDLEQALRDPAMSEVLHGDCRHAAHAEISEAITMSWPEEIEADAEQESDGAELNAEQESDAGESASGRLSSSDIARDLSEGPWLSSDDLEVQTLVGVGSTSKIYKGTYTGKQVAIKCMCDDNDGQGVTRAFWRELRSLQQFRHPHIVQMVGIVGPSPLMLLTQYCAGGSLFDLLHNCWHIPLNWKQRIKILLDISSAVDYLHSERFMHRDLKSPNCLLVEPITDEERVPHVCLSDFGWARRMPEEVRFMSMGAGTKHWMAPEVCVSSEYDYAADTFSFGIVVYEVLCRRMAFEDLDPEEASMRLQGGERPTLRHVPSGAPADLVNLMERCWHQLPSSRLRFGLIARLLRAIEPQSFTEIDSDTSSAIEQEWRIDDSEITTMEICGVGVTCAVFKALYRGKPVAVKILKDRKQENDERRKFRSNAIEEFKVWATFDHPSIVKMHGIVMGRSLKLCIEYCAGGTLFDLLHNCWHIELPWHQRIRCLIDLASAVHYLHTRPRRIVHMDLTSLNVLLLEPILNSTQVPILKLTDFGIARCAGRTRKKRHSKRLGTAHWKAPEPTAGEPEERADAFSFSFIIYETIYRHMPFEELDSDEASMKIEQGFRPDVYSEGVLRGTPPALMELMVSNWHEDGLQRMCFADIYQELLSINQSLSQPCSLLA
eukprot:TRINITY_DN19560_c0_g2_i1.p1 TRINITY_DN19560_c0_g2~~TRINITY_DN19560_c0_g2_i1.p1  ORF type:complete len:666 (+),score=112.34 TRINITY_DN19560_c0_g2_i1:77-2074(+)